MASDDIRPDPAVDRRRAIRYPVEARVILKRRSGECVHAIATDISSSGMRLRFDAPCDLKYDDEVVVEVELPECPDRAFSSWGLGRVAHLGNGTAGIQLFGGEFGPPPPEGWDGA